MPRNIKEIRLSKKSYNNNGIRPVKIEFNTLCNWTLLDIEDLKQIIRLWIKGEEEKYPQTKNCKGRWMLFDEIKKVFDEK